MLSPIQQNNYKAAVKRLKAHQNPHFTQQKLNLKPQEQTNKNKENSLFRFPFEINFSLKQYQQVLYSNF